VRTSQSFVFDDLSKLKTQLLQWGQQFEEVIWLDSNSYKHKTFGTYEAILAVDAFTTIKTDTQNAFDQLKEYQESTKDWLFGYLTYDLKNDIEALKSSNIDEVNFPDLYFFQPKKIIYISKNTIVFEYLRMVDDEINTDFNTISNEFFFEEIPTPTETPKIKLRLTKDQYKEKISTIKKHIALGDIYEANFCQEFYAENATINPLSTYTALNNISRSPMASFLKIEDKYALCASPERYIKKENNRIFSQPIKGTAKRGHSLKEDIKLATDLERNQKERSENIMIVDLVRNDLSKTAIKNSVKVTELCKIHSFKQVHQLISTVSSTLKEKVSVIDVLKTTFPMGSMTGAPKISAMQIIENLEITKRGLYSGSIGFFTPNGDFDFNVVIRSILYNQSKKYISISVGGAITHKSLINDEYEECLLKAKAMRKVLE